MSNRVDCGKANAGYGVQGRVGKLCQKCATEEVQRRRAEKPSIDADERRRLAWERYNALLEEDNAWTAHGLALVAFGQVNTFFEAEGLDDEIVNRISNRYDECEAVRSNAWGVFSGEEPLVDFAPVVTGPVARGPFDEGTIVTSADEAREAFCGEEPKPSDALSPKWAIGSIRAIVGADDDWGAETVVEAVRKLQAEVTAREALNDATEAAYDRGFGDEVSRRQEGAKLDDAVNNFSGALSTAAKKDEPEPPDGSSTHRRFIGTLPISNHGASALRGGGIHHIGDLVQKTEHGLLKIHGIGIKTLREIKAALEAEGLHLGTKLEGLKG